MKSRYATILLILAIAMASTAYILAKTRADVATCKEGKCQNPAQKVAEPGQGGGGSDIYEVSYHHFIVSSFR